MDRNARIMSFAVVAFATAIGIYLAWNPRGMPRHGGWFRPAADTERTASPDFDPARVIGDVDISADSGIPDESTRVRDHLAQLSGAGLDLTQEEIASVTGDTAHDAVSTLRPYWLNEELRASVRVGGQLLGEVDALADIPLVSVDVMRLEFSATEPHWIIQIFMK